MFFCSNCDQIYNLTKNVKLIPQSGGKTKVATKDNDNEDDKEDVSDTKVNDGYQNIINKIINNSAET